MKIEEAEKIVKLYGGILGRSKGENEIALKKSLLPYPVAQIKEAFYVYIDELVKLSMLKKDIGEALVNSYASLEVFIDDNEAEEINNFVKIVKNKQLKMDNPDHDNLKNKFAIFSRTKLINFKLREEIDKYIAECYRKYNSG